MSRVKCARNRKFSGSELAGHPMAILASELSRLSGEALAEFAATVPRVNGWDYVVVEARAEYQPMHEDHLTRADLLAMLEQHRASVASPRTADLKLWEALEKTGGAKR